jgi:hypothetical protein
VNYYCLFKTEDAVLKNFKLLPTYDSDISKKFKPENEEKDISLRKDYDELKAISAR